jgi:chemotaxis protein CheD
MVELIVGIGDCRASKDSEDVLVTHALGSCIAVLIHDPVAKVAGMLHYLLPESALDGERARKRPFAYADTGIPLLLQMVGQLGAIKTRMVVIAIGGAQMMDPHGTFNIGKRNYLAMRKNLWKAGVTVHREVIGGTNSRTVRMDVASGRVRLRTSGEVEQDVVVNLTKKRPTDGIQHSYRE